MRVGNWQEGTGRLVAWPEQEMAVEKVDSCWRTELLKMSRDSWDMRGSAGRRQA